VTEQQTTWQGGLLGLHALTALHPGSGAALGTVDLPVQRERHTHWPNIAGSALKGILRDACRERVSRRGDLDQMPRFDDKHDEQGNVTERADRRGRPRERADATLELNELFGPPAGQSSDFAGAVSVTDARLLAFPVRSLKGVFAWVACPAVLERLKRDADLTGLRPAWGVPDVAGRQAVVSDGCPCLVNGTSLLLEEFDFTKAGGDAGPIAEWVARRLLPRTPAYEATVARFPKQFIVLSNDDFTHFARYATEVTARIGLDYATKTVREGALFYQEFLPAETVFYSVVLANAARTRLSARDAGGMLQKLEGYLNTIPVLQVGGDETTGKGFCSVRFHTQGDNS
jgi:CRISPR-associated protein Cmr4